jgi:hypothetical protein
MKEFEIEVVHPDGDIRFAAVLDYQEVEAGHLELCGANQTIAEINLIRIVFNYPLPNSVTRRFNLKPDLPDATSYAVSTKAIVTFMVQSRIQGMPKAPRIGLKAGAPMEYGDTTSMIL